MGVDALAVGDADLVFGLDWLTARAALHSLPMLSANLVDRDGSRIFPGWRVLEAGGVRTGVFGLTGGDAPCPGCVVTDPTAAAAEAVEALRAEGCALIVGLTQMGDEGAEQLASVVPGIDLIFVAGNGITGRFPELAGETWILRASARGKRITGLTLTLTSGASGLHSPEVTAEAAAKRGALEGKIEQTLATLEAAETPASAERTQRSLDRYRSQRDRLGIADQTPEGRHVLTLSKADLDASVADDAGIAALVAQVLDGISNEEAAGVATRREGRIGDFAGSPACRACQPEQHRHHQGTRHAGAHMSLVREQRHLDESCIACHATGFHLDGGPTRAGEVAYLGGVQCEACHGPSAAHVADPSAPPPLAGLAASTCVACHNETSHGGDAPEFSPESALDAVRCPTAPAVSPEEDAVP